MSHKSRQDYVKLFREVRRSLIDEFGDIGVQKTVMMDFEVSSVILMFQYSRHGF